MSKEYSTMLKVLKHFSGLNKLDAFDLLHKMEVTLFYASSPISTKNLKQIILSDIEKVDWIDPFHFTFLPNGNLCEFVGSNEWLQVYKEKNKFLPDWAMFRVYYFKTVYAPLELRKLTRKNLLGMIRGKDKEKEIQEFLKQHSITMTNKITNRLLLLDL
ncbi:hypothetical protein [Aquimarina algiphila]|uniref:Uncharacterized protein n=1 Tax=Aquimarina algiphila TaxID=2047982 RepID=A0A554VB79_9FLAO|nr:hypothetical protein [Aquimarina algiphila]TSE03734.1 hypothetical protein FOF46_28595 [Aquimarina algiphila]